MSNIIFNVAALVCEAPEVVSSNWTGIRYVFSVDWKSKGDEYILFDPTVNMEASIEIYQNTYNPPQLEYTGVIDANAPYNVNGYTFNVLDFHTTFSAKYDLYLVLKLTSEACSETVKYKFPIDYP